MEQLIFQTLAFAASYLLGSISFAVIISRLMGLKDPRTYGSHNPGATNVLRSGSKAAAALTVLLDTAKGFLPVVLVRWLGADYNMDEGVAALAGVAAFVGHAYPVFLRFRGGKGVATALGALLGIHWLLGVLVLAIWLVVVLATRYSSLGAIVAALLVVPVYLLLSGIAWTSHVPVTLAIGFMALLLLWRHWGNINRLLGGTESRIGSKSPGGAATAPPPHAAHPKRQHRKKNRH